VLLFALALARAGAAQEPVADRSAKVHQLYESGVKDYAEGRYDTAVESFQQAYQLSALPSLLFNIAQAYRQKGSGSCGLALRYYRDYLQQRPLAPDRATIEARIAEMDACARLEAPSPAAAPPPAATPQPSAAPPPAGPDRPHTSRVWPWVTLGTGAALLVGGVVVNRAAAARFDELRGECPCPRQTWEGWQTADQVGYVLLATGGAAIVGGFVLWLQGRGRESPEPRTSVVPTGRGVAMRVTFP
jgi:hypothetical protein